MTTTANNQTANTANHDTNNLMGEGTLNYQNDNIKLATRLSNIFGRTGMSKIAATAALGLALTIGLAMPGAALADIPSVSESAGSQIINLNDDFSMVYGIPDSGLELGGVNTGGPAGVRVSNAVLDFDGYNDDFSMVIGIPDLELGQASRHASLRFSNEVLDFGGYNDDFSMVIGIPDLELGQASRHAGVRVSNDVLDFDGYNDDFSMVYGIPDSGLELGGVNTGGPAGVRVSNDVLDFDGYNDDFSMVIGIPDVRS